MAHPQYSDVLLTSLAGLDRLPDDVDAVVSLCRIGSHQTDREHVEFWLVNRDRSNPNLDLVLADAVATVAALRAEGKRVAIQALKLEAARRPWRRFGVATRQNPNASGAVVLDPPPSEVQRDVRASTSPYPGLVLIDCR